MQTSSEIKFHSVCSRPFSFQKHASIIRTQKWQIDEGQNTLVRYNTLVRTCIGLQVNDVISEWWWPLKLQQQQQQQQPPFYFA